MIPDLSALCDQILERACAIHQIPAPTFDESERAAAVQAWFAAEGLADVATDACGNVYARLPGSGAARPLVVSAHLDTVFPRSTDLTIKHSPGRISAPGIGDNSLGVAGLFGLLWSLRQARQSLPGDLWLAANTAEEGLGNLQGMQGVVQRFGATPQAYIILEGMALGSVYHRALGSQRYRIQAHTAGGHSWVDYGQPSAVHELARLAAGLGALPVPTQPRSSLNIGVFQGGTSVNTIANQAELMLDLRSEGPQALGQLAAQVQALVAAVQRPGVTFTSELVGKRPTGEIPASHPLVRLAVECLAAQGLAAALNIGSTDANIPLSQDLPAVTIGLTNGGGAHTPAEYIQTAPLRQGMAQLVLLVERLFA